ncbi:MAG: hypothetical protein J6P20_03970 [Oscillospiraceae bacterium]|nr:hypothetical protein [Oscillospiraceae bacterium]
MNIIETVRKILTDYPQISAVCNAVHIDFTDNAPNSYGLSSVDDKLITEDILGNERRQHTFLLYATFSSINDYERLQNSNALLDLNYYLAAQSDIAIDGGMLRKIEAGNGMLYDVPAESLVTGYQYQMQIVAEYEKLA